MRRALGYRLDESGRQLEGFVAHLDAGALATVSGEDTGAMFVAATRTRASYARFNIDFSRMLDSTGITSAAGRRPHAHDLRHSFAVRTLLGWYRDGANVHALLPRLSTYLGHVEPAST